MWAGSPETTDPDDPDDPDEPADLTGARCGVRRSQSLLLDAAAAGAADEAVLASLEPAVELLEESLLGEVVSEEEPLLLEELDPEPRLSFL